ALQATSIQTYFEGTGEERADPQLSRVVSVSTSEPIFTTSVLVHYESTSRHDASTSLTPESDPRNTDPKDYLPPKQDKTKSGGDGLETAHIETKIKKESAIEHLFGTNTEEVAQSSDDDGDEEIKWADLTELVQERGADSKLKVLDEIPDILNKVFASLDKFANAISSASQIDENLGVPSTSQNTPQTEGEQIRDKGKKVMSQEEVAEEQFDSDYDVESRPSGTLEESSNTKPLKKFTYITVKGERYQMTKEEIKNQKGINKWSMLML
nr:hypothetical protein [Tanacetum cinerariifolium]